jgi:hypothetical protein
MIPMLMKIKIPRQEKRSITIYLPVFLAWILLMAVFLLLLPFILLTALFTWFRGYGKIFVLFFPMLFNVLWHLQGLLIDVQDKEGHIYFSFI